MKKLICPLVCLALCALMSFPACSAHSAESTGQTSNESTTASTKADKPEESGSKGGEKTTLKFWAVKEDTVEDMNTNEYIKWVEEECNVDIEFEQASSAEPLQKLNLSLASGSYPDVYYAGNRVMSGMILNSTLMKYGGAGIFLPLNDMIEQYGVNTQKLLNDVDYIKTAITMPDGNIYALPSYSEIYHCRYSNKLWIDQTWLDNLQLKMPTTTDEYYEVLKKFKEEDANGNGDPNDEIPLAGCIDGWYSDPSLFLMNAFIYEDAGQRLMIEDGKIVSTANKEEYRDGLRYVNKLYSEGLLYSESYSQTAEQMKSMTSMSPNIVGSLTVGAPMGVMDGNSELYKNCVTVAPLAGPKGVRFASYFGYGDLRPGAYIITSSCKNPDVAFQLADFMYSDEASVRLRQGVRDVDWRDAKEGEMTFDGKSAQYSRLTPLITNGAAQNNNMGNTGLFQETNDSFIGAWAVGEGFDIRSMDGIEQLLMEQTVPYDGFEPEKTVPPMIFTDEENSEVSIIETEVVKLIKEQRALFIMGQKNLDSDWESYVSALDQLGLPRMIEIYNTAYTRMNSIE